jgi:hypothetical protein
MFEVVPIKSDLTNCDTWYECDHEYRGNLDSHLNDATHTQHSFHRP